MTADGTRRAGVGGASSGSPSTRAAATPARGGRVIASAARAPNTSPSSSELLASRLAPCTPVQATSPAANSPRDRRAAVEVGLDAAHDVVRGRAHRNPIGRQIEPGLRGTPAVIVGNRLRT